MLELPTPNQMFRWGPGGVAEPGGRKPWAGNDLERGQRQQGELPGLIQGGRVSPGDPHRVRDVSGKQKSAEIGRPALGRVGSCHTACALSHVISSMPPYPAS